MYADFEIGMKIYLEGEKGLIVKSPQDEAENLIGIILWDTPSVSETEDWRGLWGTFKQSGGEVLPPDTVFTYIKSVT